MCFIECPNSANSLGFQISPNKHQPNRPRSPTHFTNNLARHRQWRTGRLAPASAAAVEPAESVFFGPQLFAGDNRYLFVQLGPEKCELGKFARTVCRTGFAVEGLGIRGISRWESYCYLFIILSPVVLGGLHTRPGLFASRINSPTIKNQHMQ